MPSLRQFFSHRLIWLALLVALGIGALFARTIWTIRNDEWSYAAQTNANLARTLEQGLAWSLDSFDKSLERVAREVARPEVWALPPDLRARVVFDNSLRARGAGDVLVLDAQGNVILDSGSLEPRKANFADRDYFAQTCQAVIDSREQVVGQLKALGFEVLPSAANFIFARHPEHDAAALATKLREQGVIVRHFKQLRIAQFLRITIGTPEQNAALIEGLADI